MYAQITYTYIEPDPALEADKKAKEAYFKQLRDDAFTNSVNCSKQCGSHAADANNPDPCGKSDAINVCLCACATRYQSSLSAINKQEQDWLRTAAKRQKDYENRKIKEQQIQLNNLNQIKQQQDVQNQQQEAAQAKLNQVQQQLAEQQQHYQQTQIELDNAKKLSMNAYQEAINSGKMQSDAMLNATLAGAQQISDSKGQLVYTGVGLGISLFTHLSEKKAERKEKELKEINEQEQRQLIEQEKQLVISTKLRFIKEAIQLNQYNDSDLISKDRYAVLLLIPKFFTSDEQKIYFTNPIKIPKYSDGTYPLKDYVQSQLSEALDKEKIKYKSIYILYPITNLEKISSEFVKKMGSGKVIYLNAELLNYIKLPFKVNKKEEADNFFWNN